MNNIYDVLKESYNTNEEITEEGLFRKIKELIKGKNKNKDENDVPASVSIKDGKTPYTVKKVTSKSMLDKFYKNNDFCIESAPKESSFPQIVANLLAKNYDINTPVEVYFVTGKVMNDIYDLAGDNAYQDSVHHAIIPLDTLKNTKDIIYAKNTIKARYFNDVVDNNEYREYTAGRHKKSPQIQWIINAYANESYYDEDELHSSNLLKEENTMSINTLANLARSAGFENLLIESDIVEECKKVLDSLDTIDESNITGDISVLPVYRVDNNDIDSSISESSLESIEEVSIIDLKNKLSTGIKNFIDKKNQKRENDSKDIPKATVDAAKKFAAKTTNVKKLQRLVAVHTRNLNLTIENEKKFKSASKEEQQKTINVYNRLNVYGKGKNHTAADVLTDLSTTKSAYKQIINIYSKRIKELESVKESYFIDLETLYTVSEVYDVELNEAINLIKEVNELPEDASVSVVLKEGFENYTTLSEFVDIKETLNEAGIDLAWNKELSDEDFITEAGKLSGLIDKVKDKIKTMKVANLEKTIKQTEDFNKALKENLKKFDKMNEEEQKSYVNKEFAKDVVVYAGSLAAITATSVAAPAAVMVKPFLGYALLGGTIVSGFIPAIRMDKKADKGQPSFVKSPKTYRRAITNTIEQNNILIKNCKEDLKDAKK